MNSFVVVIVIGVVDCRFSDERVLCELGEGLFDWFIRLFKCVVVCIW